MSPVAPLVRATRANAPPGPAVLARVPLALAPNLDAGAVHEQVQRAARAPVGQLHGERLLASAERRMVRHRPVQTSWLQQARDEAGRLPQWQAEQDLHRQARLDRRIAVDRLRAALAGWCRMPGRRRVEPDGQRSALTQPGVGGRPVQGAVADRRGLGHAAQLCRWTRDVNPGQPSCNKVW